jgi:hypothetical protein
MKKLSWILRIISLTAFGLIAIGIGNAQHDSQIMKVKIPFDFSIGTQNYLAGEYRLKPLLQHTMLLLNERGQTLTSIATNSVESRAVPGSARLVFNGYSGRYFLTQIWQAGNRSGQEAIKSPVEIEIAKSPPGLTAVSFVTHP